MSQASRIIVTGASSGLGQALARELLLRGDSVDAVARRADRLAALAADGDVRAHPLDLTDGQAVADFIAAQADQPLDGLILNAGMTASGPFIEGDDATDARMIALNVSANLQLVRGLLPSLVQTRGKILFVASLGGLTPMAYQAVYGGTKAFVISYALALREELRGTGVQVSVFAPGGIETEMTNIPDMAHLKSEMAPVDTVARAAIRAYDTMPALHVPGAKNRAIALAAKFLPRPFLTRQGAKIYRPD